MNIQKKQGYHETICLYMKPKKRTYVAIAHSILIAIYHVLKDNVPFRDLGAEYYNQFNRERKINAYLKKLKALGWDAPVAKATPSVRFLYPCHLSWGKGKFISFSPASDGEVSQ